MPYTIFDYRHDVKNLFVTPRIRSRFLRMEPGEVSRGHSHDLGHEVFLILEGQCELEIDGERAVLGPGQMCVAFAHQMHQVRTVGDTPMTMYLSVTPHVEPTHTTYDQETGERLPPRYNSPSTFDQEDATAGVSTAALAERFAAAYRALTETVQTAVTCQDTALAALSDAVSRDDLDGLARAMDGLWEQVCATHDRLDEMTAAWNALAPRASKRS